jgi:hypothetical protein
MANSPLKASFDKSSSTLADRTELLIELKLLPLRALIYYTGPALGPLPVSVVWTNPSISHVHSPPPPPLSLYQENAFKTTCADTHQNCTVCLEGKGHYYYFFFYQIHSKIKIK